jgi:hypothetical protein
MFREARWRYLAAMGVSGVGLSMAAASCSSQPVDAVHEPVTPGTGAVAVIPTVAPEASASAAPTASVAAPVASASAAPSASAVAVAPPLVLTRCPKPAPKVAPQPPGPGRMHMPTCPSGDLCIAEPKDPGATTAAAPYGRCPATVNEAAPHGFGSSHAFTTFDPAMTKEERACNKDICCYSWVVPCPGGRLLRDGDDRAACSPIAARGDWLAPIEGIDALDPSALPTALRAQLAERWAAEASFEHASIASFARASLELLALGAPPALLAGAQAAALDEVTHARLTYALASAYAGRALGPGALPVAALGVAAPSFASLAAGTFRDACLGETVASLRAEAAAEATTCSPVNAVLRTIAADEGRHAELAWKTLAWALREGGDAAARALRAEIDALLAHGPTLDPGAVGPLDLAEHGFLSARDDGALRLRALREVVIPCAEALLASAQGLPFTPVSTPSALASIEVP